MPRPPTHSKDELARMADQLAEAGCCTVERLKHMAGCGSTDRLAAAVKEANTRWQEGLALPTWVYFEGQLRKVRLDSALMEHWQGLRRAAALRVLAAGGEPHSSVKAGSRPAPSPLRTDLEAELTRLSEEVRRLREELAAVEQKGAEGEREGVSASNEVRMPPSPGSPRPEHPPATHRRGEAQPSGDSEQLGLWSG